MEDAFLFDMGRGGPPALRPYQRAAVRSVQMELDAAQRCLCIAATGVGKTEIFSELAVQAAPDGDVLIVVPRDILVSQTAERLRGRGLQCHIEQGPLRGGSGCTVASYKSLISRRRYDQYLGRSKLVCVDEVHDNYSKRSVAMLQEFLDSGSKLVGFTASPQRMNGDPLTTFYGRPAFEYWLRDAIRDGWLVPPKLWLTVARDWDFSQFSEAAQEFDPLQLDLILRREESVHLVASLIADHYEDECSVAFCHSIRQAEAVQEVLDRRGIRASLVHSKMDKADRDEQLEAFITGKAKICLNVQVLTMGFDHAPIRKLFLCKPTKSEARYLQQLGRACRPLVGGLLNSLHTAEQRKAAIAQSEKPFFEVFDITDTSRSCQLVTALDVLAPPNLPDNIVRRAKRRLEGQPGAVAFDDLLHEEAAEQAREDEAQYALERERRREMIVGVTFDAYSRDPFAEPEAIDKPKRRRGWYMKWGKHKGTHVADVQTDYLLWFWQKFQHHKDQAFIQGVKHELDRRKRIGFAV